MRAERDIAKHPQNGRLMQVLRNYREPPAEIHAVYPQRHQMSGRVRVFVDFLAGRFGGPAGVAWGVVGRYSIVDCEFDV